MFLLDCKNCFFLIIILYIIYIYPESSPEIGPGEFESHLEVLVLFILDPAQVHDEFPHLLLQILLKPGPVCHPEVSSCVCVLT